MIIKKFKIIKPSDKYQFVNLIEYPGRIQKWQAYIPNINWMAFFELDCEVAAAKAVDLKLIEKKKEPVNILKRKL